MSPRTFCIVVNVASAGFETFFARKIENSTTIINIEKKL